MMPLRLGGAATPELEQLIASSDSLFVVLLLAALLGLRHAADPDHLVAVSTLVATDADRPARRAAELGFGWGLGHAASLTVFGLPVVLFGSYLPDSLQALAEALAGVLIALLAIRLLVHWRRGRFHAHTHVHDGVVHRHLHDHQPAASGAEHGHNHILTRSPVQAAGVGLVHGVGGSAPVAVLLLASISDRGRAAAALLLFAASTAVAMTILSLAFGYTLGRAPARRGLGVVVPALGVLSLVFGVVYAYGAIDAAQ